MQTTEIMATIHKSVREKSGQARRRAGLRRWIARLNPWTLAWYALLTVVGVLLYKAGAAYALRERGYYAIGGEALALLLPALCYTVGTTIWDIAKNP